MGKEVEDRIARAWRESAPYWDRHRDHLAVMFAPLTTALVQAARVEPGQRVLDVAGGSGEPAFSLAELVGSSGRVFTTDVADAMVAATHRRSVELGLANVRAAVCSAQALPFRDASFDCAVCRLGSMFFPAPTDAVREMARVTRPGGRVGFVVWGAQDRNPFFTVISEAFGRVVPSEPDPPGMPNAWRFAEPGSLALHLRAAGLVDVEDTTLSFDIELPVEFAEFWTMRVEMSESLREKSSRLDAATRAKVDEEVRLATIPYFETGHMKFPAEVFVVSGTAALD